MSGSDQELSGEHAALAAVLDIYGADLARWPAAERLRFAPLLAADATAIRLRAEAQALDRLLDVAGGADAVSSRAGAPRGGASEAGLEALTERIMAAAAATDPLRRGSPIRSEVTSLRVRGAAGAEPLTTAGGAASSARPTAALRRPLPAISWPVLSLMAASLLVGVVGGASGAFDRIGVPWLGGAVAGAEDDLEVDAFEMAFSDEDNDWTEEDGT